MTATAPDKVSEFLRKQHWVPHEYQREAIKFGLQQSAVGYLLDPGLGKTSVMLAVFDILRQKRMVKNMLVIAPLRVCYLTWPAEVDKWAEFHHLSIGLLHGDEKDKVLRKPHDIYLINPEGLQWLFHENNRLFNKFDVLCIDESTRFKNTSTVRFKTLRPRLNLFKRRYIMTGTPAPNGLMDLFGQIYVLDQGGALGRFITHYRREYFYPTGYMGREWAPKETAAERIKAKIEPFTMRLKAEDYLKLPELIYNRILVELPPEARTKYNELERAFITVIQDKEVTAVNAGAASIKLRQLANGGVYSGAECVELHTAKADALRDLIDELNGQPILVLYQFVHDIARIRQALGKKDLPFIGGGTNSATAEALCRGFNAGILPILLAHPMSVGHGLNLQGRSNHVAFFGPTWNLEDHDQSIRRVYRQGNPNTHVTVHSLVARNTVDVAIEQALTSKDRTQRTLLDALRKYYGATPEV